MTRHDKNETDWLDADLAALKDTRLPSADFMARMTADALAVQPVRTVDAPKVSGLRQILDVLGGWGGVSGLAMATCVGFAVGVSGLETLDGTLDVLWGAAGGQSDNSLSTSAFGWDVEEG